MTDKPEWFAPKRYGYGSGVPISWQGWVLTLCFVAIAVALGIAFRTDPLRFMASVAPFTIAFMVVCARTTRGGWRWRWGDED